MNNAGRISKSNWMNIWILGLIGQICWNIENSWFNTFVYDKISKDPSIITWMVGVSAIVSTASAFLIGTWSDRVGRRKPFIALGYILWGIFTITFGFAQFLPKSPFMAVIVFIVAADAIMSFFGSAGYDAGFQAWTTDISNEKNRGKLGAVFAALPVLATIFGAVVSGIIVQKYDFFIFFILMGSIVMLAGLWALFTVKDAYSLKPTKSMKGYWKQLAQVFSWKTVLGNRELFWVFVLNAVFFSGFNIYFPYITIYLNNYLGMDYGLAGVLQGVGLIAALVLTIPASKLIEQGKLSLTIIAAVLCNIIGLVLIVLVGDQTLQLLIAIFFAGIGYVLMIQTVTAWIKNLFPAQQRGQFEGVRMIFAVCIPMVLGPNLAAVVINRYGVFMEIDDVSGYVPTESLFLFAAIFTMLTLLPLLPASKRMKKRIEEREAK